MLPAVVGFYGKTDIGKTSLIVRLVKRLTDEGYNIATVKNTDKNIGMDTRGKDTWHHSEAGATVVVLSSPVETDFIIKNKKTEKEIIDQITLMGQYDFILVEGARDPAIQKIRLGNIEKRENTIAQYHENFEEIVNLIKDMIKGD